VIFSAMDLKKGTHPLSFRVDGKNGVAEIDEDNNRLSRKIDCKAEN
jgi:subtilase family serine protease